MRHSFFLYGIYSENQKCYSRFKDLIVRSRSAEVTGTLHILDCGLGLLDSRGETRIPGQWVDIEAPETYLPILDALCGFDPQSAKKSFVLRKELPILSADEGAGVAFAYCLNSEKKLAGGRTLEGQSAQEYLTQPTENLLDKLTERQKTYIQKLAQAKGREIVPVDMALYRELMSLELIVDKGRRLALSRLGTELSWFL